MSWYYISLVVSLSESGVLMDLNSVWIIIKIQLN